MLMAGFAGFSQSAQLGIKGGVNIADFNDEAGSTSSRTGFNAGILVHIHTKHPSLAIQPELVYSAQGAEFSSGTQKLDYVNIPVLLQYLFGSGFRLETGPQLGVLAQAEFENNNGVKVKNKNNFESTDVSWAFGLGYMAPGGFGVDARYNLGLTDVTKGNPDIKNRVWQFGIFYQFKR